MGLSKSIRKIFKTRKKKEKDDEIEKIPDFNRGNNGRSIRGGIYEPYRQHFPLKSQQMPTYPGHPMQQPEPNQNSYGPKLITGADEAQNLQNNYPYMQMNQFGKFQMQNNSNKIQQRSVGPNGNYEMHNPASRLNRASSNASVCSYAPYQQQFNPYQQHPPLQQQTPQQRFGSNMSINHTGSVTGNEVSAYETMIPNNRRQPLRSNSINFQSTYEQVQLNPGQQNRGLSRQGSVSSIYQTGQAVQNYPNFYPGQGRPRRPSSAMTSLPSRSMSDAATFESMNRPIRPSSAQGSCLNLEQNFDGPQIMSPMTDYPSSVNSSFVIGHPNQRVMSPVGSQYGMMSSTSSFDHTRTSVEQQSSLALHRLRSSQVNLQQALRVQEDLSRQAGNAKPGELDATMKIMQTCLDMLDSISGLVERSSTPQPQNQLLNTRMFEGRTNNNFINHQKMEKPLPKSALKQRIPTTTSAFDKLLINNEEIKELSPGLSEDSEGFYGSTSQDESNYGQESPGLSHTSPGPSVMSEDSGFAYPVKNLVKPIPVVAKPEEKSEPRLIRSRSEPELKDMDDNSAPMLTSLMQLKIGPK